MCLLHEFLHIKLKIKRYGDISVPRISIDIFNNFLGRIVQHLRVFEYFAHVFEGGGIIMSVADALVQNVAEINKLFFYGKSQRAYRKSGSFGAV